MNQCLLEGKWNDFAECVSAADPWRAIACAGEGCKGGLKLKCQ